MTTVYFVRHAEPNYDNHDDVSRELSPKGLQSSKNLVNSFAGIQIDTFYSSPYLRAIDTIKPLADSRGQTIHLIPDFRERKITDHWIEDFQVGSPSPWFRNGISDPWNPCFKSTQTKPFSLVPMEQPSPPLSTTTNLTFNWQISTGLNIFSLGLSSLSFKGQLVQVLMKYIKRNGIAVPFNHYRCVILR